MDRVEKGRHAQRLLEDPVLGEILAAIEDEILAEWKIADTSVAREELHFRWRAAVSFRGQIQSLLNDAVMADRAGKIRPW